ncbi:unnamed protein product [Schistosoma mattheei]|uniref:Uncharacterized protein n=1 Tax=Schistosoma mattheei TaxID=31246 RepID=A0A183P946_9TREM|nr:unnamed protein product [Schistosoma mattheei]
MYLHLRVDVYFGTRTRYCSFQMPSRYTLRYCVMIIINDRFPEYVESHSRR